jgi:hypothetical protein
MTPLRSSNQKFFEKDLLTVAGEKDILTPEETALYLRKSLSWVYKNAELLGGRKLGGSLFFPAKEDLYERIFCKRKGMEVRLHPQENQVHGNLVQNENRSQEGRGQKERGGKESAADRGGANRHGLLGPGESPA